jgi:hypothetical protein
MLKVDKPVTQVAETATNNVSSNEGAIPGPA